MEFALVNHGDGDLMPANDGDVLWPGQDGQRSPELPPAVALAATGVPADGAGARSPGIGQSPSYWRHLQRLSDADALNAAEVLELLLHFGRSSSESGQPDDPAP